MGRCPGLKLLLIALFGHLLLAGCAGTARGVKQSVYQHDDGLSAVDRSRSQADAMVVIRYPAVVDEAALPAWYQAFQQHPIGGRLKADEVAAQESDRIAQSLLAKSNYFTMSLYRELRDALPADSVLLSPHLVELDRAGTLLSRPLLATEEIPSVLTIDFNVYSFPDPARMMDGEPLTFGDIVTPLFTVHASRWLRPATHGLLLASEALLGPAAERARGYAEAQAAGRLGETAAPLPPSLDFVALLDHGAADGPDERVEPPLKRPGASNGALLAVEVHPLEKITMDGARVARLTPGIADDPFSDAFTKGAATRIVTALNRIDHDRATFFARQAALARFDPQLGVALLARMGGEDVRARLRMAEALLEAERKFIAAQSGSLYAGSFEGAYGGSMREMIAAEYNLLEERRDLARRQNIGTALAVLALAGAIVVGENIDSGNYRSYRALGNVLALSSVWAASSAIASHAQSRTVGENFLVQLAPAIDNQVTVQVEWLESRESISARDFGEFRQKTLALYQSSVRSVGVGSDPACVIRHPALQADGRWVGICRDGLAEGNGYGVVLDERGYIMEYLGAARAGLPDGDGAMLFDAPADRGAMYYEGSFRRGLPHGVVRVEKPGREPRVRTYRDGNDRGAADADELREIRF
jgi:hypothetical protein